MLLAELKGKVDEAEVLVIKQQNFVDYIQGRIDRGDEYVEVMVDGVVSNQDIHQFQTTSKATLANYTKNFQALSSMHDKLQALLDDFVSSLVKTDIGASNV